MTTLTKREEYLVKLGAQLALHKLMRVLEASEQALARYRESSPESHNYYMPNRHVEEIQTQLDRSFECGPWFGDAQMEVDFDFDMRDLLS